MLNPNFDQRDLDYRRTLKIAGISMDQIKEIKEEF